MERLFAIRSDAGYAPDGSAAPDAGPASRAREYPIKDDPNTIAGLLDETARLARTRFDRELRARLPGMTCARCAVLIHLAQHKTFNQTALAQILAIRPITLVRLLDRLEAAGFVERMPDPNDRRAHILALTVKALPIIESIHDLNRRTCGGLQLGISEAEASQLRALLSRIRTHLALLAGPYARRTGKQFGVVGSYGDRQAGA